LENQLSRVGPEVEAQKEKVFQLQMELAACKDQVATFKQSNEQFAALVHQKADQISHMAETTRKATEQYNTLKRKLDAKGDSAESEQYRLLLMCQSCNNNFKSHVLLKCMHTFW
jgi:uncharacterized protein (DUF3084 family)